VQQYYQRKVLEAQPKEQAQPKKSDAQ
jgi:hypothetical protein